MKLYELPRKSEGTKIYLDPGATLEIGKKTLTADQAIILFWHIDGMYSYSTVVDITGEPYRNSDKTRAVVHLQASTPIHPYKDGYMLGAGDDE